MHRHPDIRLYANRVGAGLNRKPGGSWFRPGIPNPLVRGVNHFDDRGKEPAGSNEGYLDGHVAWVAGKKFYRQPKMDFGGLTLYFYAGVE